MFVCLGILTRIAHPGMITLNVIASVCSGLLFITMAMPTALLVSGRGE